MDWSLSGPQIWVLDITTVVLAFGSIVISIFWPLIGGVLLSHVGLLPFNFLLVYSRDFSDLLFLRDSYVEPLGYLLFDLPFLVSGILFILSSWKIRDPLINETRITDYLLFFGGVLLIHVGMLPFHYYVYSSLYSSYWINPIREDFFSIMLLSLLPLALGVILLLLSWLRRGREAF
jgi:hypothetical protein